MQRRRQNEAAVIRADQRQRHPTPDPELVYEKVSPEGAESLAMFTVRAAPGHGTNLLTHGGDENLLVLSGRAEVEIEGETHTLEAGDSVYIPRGQRHRVTSVGSEPVEAIFVLSPPAY